MAQLWPYTVFDGLLICVTSSFFVRFNKMGKNFSNKQPRRDRYIRSKLDDQINMIPSHILSSKMIHQKKKKKKRK